MTDARSLDATSYDRWFDSRWGSYAFAIERDALFTALGPIAGRSVLDVGCGTGRFSAALEAGGAQVTCIDDDPTMLRVARGRVAGPLLEADAHDLPFPDASFDIALAVTLLEFTDRPEKVIDELRRVTRPDGHIAVATLNPRSPWGLAHAHQFHRPPWTDACLRTRRELRALVAGRGTIRLHSALYSPGPIPGLRRLGPLFERAGRLVPSVGAFQIAVIERPPG